MGVIRWYKASAGTQHEMLALGLDDGRKERGGEGVLAGGSIRNTQWAKLDAWPKSSLFDRVSA